MRKDKDDQVAREGQAGRTKLT